MRMIYSEELETVTDAVEMWSLEKLRPTEFERDELSTPHMYI